jgi:hypothetical protein
MVVVFLQVLLKLVQREVSQIDKSSWVFWRGMSGLGSMVAQGAGAATVASVSTGGDASVAPANPSTSKSGNGSAGGGNASGKQHQGKKRKK